MSGPFHLGDLADRIGGQVRGDRSRLIEGVATLEDAGPSHLSFLANPKYRRAAERTRAGALLVPPGTSLPGRDLLEASEPYLALAILLELFHPAKPESPGVSSDARIGRNVSLGSGVAVGPFAVVGDGVIVGDDVAIGAGCVLGEGVEVRERTVLHPRVVLYPRTRVGARCILHSGVVLGSDGFGFATSGGRHRKIPQVGRVVVEDDVEIGANTTVDRSALGETVIGRGTKIDNLVMVAHGVQIGPDGLFAAQSGIAGSTRVGARATFAGQAGAAGHLTIGDGCVVAAKSAVFEDLPTGSFVAGIPAVRHTAWKRAHILVKRLPELQAEIRDIARRLERLEGLTLEGEDR